MPKIKYIEKQFKAGVRDIITKANRIIDEYRTQGYLLTLRQLYYKFIARDLFPADWIDEEYNRKHNLEPNTKNTEKNYKSLGVIISDGRMAGLIDWSMIEDRGREVIHPPRWDSPEQIVEAVAKQFRIDMWDNQEVRPEVWIEKQALGGIIEATCKELSISYLACKGNLSQSEMWSSSQRFKEMIDRGQRPVVIHLGDHDPSGIDMTRDNSDRINLFVGEQVELIRIALNMDQVEEFNPPPNPAKPTDSRYEKYRVKFGDECWELDALEPAIINGLIRKQVEDLRDEDKWDDKVKEETGHRTSLAKISRNWKKVEEFVGKLK